MTTISKYAARINEIIDLADRTLATKQTTGKTYTTTSVNSELFYEFRTTSLSFILNLYGENHPFYTDFNRLVVQSNPYDTSEGRGILKSIKAEIDGGWLVTLKGLVSAEIFSDFIEMADYLLKEGYKDPAAVVIGSVLEEHLKQLCSKNKIPIEDNKSGKLVPKKADFLNSELSGKAVYNKLDQKNVTAWLDLRNKAAHGKYAEYNQQQVEFMLQTVTEFITRNSI
jgi:ribosomal protein L31